MAGNYEEAVKKVYWGLGLLAVVTLIEVGVSLFGKGHIIAGVESSTIVMFVAGGLIIALSIYKAYFIIYEFMHMGYEVRGLRMSVLLPMLLLVWGMIAFFQEGNAWKNRRSDIQKKNKMEAPAEQPQTGMLLKLEE